MRRLAAVCELNWPAADISREKSNLAFIYTYAEILLFFILNIINLYLKSFLNL